MSQEIRENNRKCTIALIFSIYMLVAAFTGTVINLVSTDSDAGINTFRYFTTLTNLSALFTSAFCIPYEIDGLLHHHYQLPPWMMVLFYTVTNCLALTFVIALCFLSPIRGFYTVMLKNANVFLHLTCPLAGMIMFILILNKEPVSFRHSLISLIPVIIYVTVYWIEVFAIGEANGGWEDFYYTNSYIPFWLFALAVPLCYFGIASLLRILHNKMHNRNQNIHEK